MRKLLILSLSTLLLSRIYATTWDEPWADKVIKEASSFILAKVISNDPEKGISIEIIKTLGGTQLKGILIINNFYLLNICSSSGHGAEFRTIQIDSCYFFVSKNKHGDYSIATPTTGYDYVLDGKVMATYRHSYHQASVPVSIYEKTMTAIFQNYHGLKYDWEYMTNFINKYLNKAPAGFAENEIDTFFLQHVALEAVHHLKLKIDENLILPFLRDSNNFHNQVSAARAMVAFNTDRSKLELLKTIEDSTQRQFLQVICVWTLAEFSPKELKPLLQVLEGKASEESDNFGGNIMDPRVCTKIPTLKDALRALNAKL